MHVYGMKSILVEEWQYHAHVEEKFLLQTVASSLKGVDLNTADLVQRKIDDSAVIMSVEPVPYFAVPILRIDSEKIRPSSLMP